MNLKLGIELKKLYYVIIGPFFFSLAIFELLKLFGIDITGFAFGLSSVNSITNDAEEDFIRPKNAVKLYLKRKYKTILNNKYPGEINSKDDNDIPCSPGENFVHSHLVTIAKISNRKITAFYEQLHKATF